MTRRPLMRISARRLVLASCLVSLVATAACMKKGEGERLSRELAAAQERAATLEQTLTAERERATAESARLEAAITAMQQRLDATGRGSADIGADVQGMRDQIQAMEGRVAELTQGLTSTQTQLREQDTALERQIEMLARKAGIDLSLRDADIPADKTEHYSAAYRAYQQADHTRARALFAEYVRRYPSDDNTDNAQYWIGKSYLDQQQPARAIGAFREVITRYRDGDALDRALFDMSDAFFQLRACADARTALEAMVQARPNSTLVRDAQRKLRELRSPPRGYCTN
jgi:TolA-binding protein